MTHADVERRRTHLHGIAAGSLFVLALFLGWTIPVAAYRLLTGDVTASALVYPALFALLVAAGLREARAWERGTRRIQPTPA